jgi:hypothetical protein
VFPDERHGFLEGADGLEIHFHRNSVSTRQSTGCASAARFGFRPMVANNQNLDGLRGGVAAHAARGAGA